MVLVDYDKLFLKADNLRNDAKVDEAIALYKDIADLASRPEEIDHKARALHMAGVSAKESVLNAESTYYRDAIGFFTQAEEAFRQADDQVALGALYRDWAIVDDYAGKDGEAVEWFQKSIEQLRKYDAPDALGITLDKFGLHYGKKGDYLTAERYIQEGIRLLEREPDAGFYHSTSLYDLARVQFKLKKFDEAIHSAEVSLSWYQADHGEHRYERRQAQLQGFLSLVYYQTGEERKAEKAAKAYKELLKRFDPTAAKVIQRDLEYVARAE